jgi:hypothetical protein
MVRLRRAVTKKSKYTAWQQKIADQAVWLIAEPARVYHMKLEWLIRVAYAALQIAMACFGLLLISIATGGVSTIDLLSSVGNTLLYFACYGLFVYAIFSLSRTTDIKKNLYVYELLKDSKEICDAIKAGALPKKTL